MMFTFEGATVYLPDEIVETTVTVTDGDPIIFGAPKAARGGSHIASLAGGDMVEAGMCDALALPWLIAQRSRRLRSKALGLSVAKLTAVCPLAATRRKSPNRQR